MLISFVNLAFFHAVLRPASSSGSIVQKKRLTVIKYVGKLCFRCLVCLKLFPKLPEPAFLILRKKPKDPLSSLPFSDFLGCRTGLVIGIGISCVNFHKIMDQHHGNHLFQADLFIGIFLQKNCHQRKMPGMLRIIFFTVSICKIRLPKNIFYFVHLYDKLHLFL